MRLLPLILSALPMAALAEDVTLSSTITDVTVYPVGAKVVREAAFSLPEGAHSLRILDLPESAILEMLRASASNVRMGTVTVRGDYVPPRDAPESEAVQAARAALAQRQGELTERQDQAASVRLARDAAEARIGFLKQLGQTAVTEGAGPGALRDLARMVGEETQAARQEVLDAEAEAREIDRDIAQLKRAVDRAQQALDALQTEAEERNLVEVAVTADQAVEGVLRVTYYTADASWLPVNDAFLTLGDTPALSLHRAAMIRQGSGENWTNVALTLSTSQPSGQVEPSVVYPELRRIYDATPPSARLAGAAKEADAPSPDPVVVEDYAQGSDLAGLIFTYAAPGPVSVASGADGLRLALGPVALVPDIRAVANPQFDQTAYLVAEYTNTSGEMLMPSDETQLYLEGEFVGLIHTDRVAAGDTARLPFGPIEGLRLTRVETRNEGDRGIISKTNQIEVQSRIEVQNLTGRTWPMRVIDRVPYSQQEDLAITWTAQPRPTQTDLNRQPGVMAWEFDLPAGQSSTIQLDHKLQWPSDKVLR